MALALNNKSKFDWIAIIVSAILLLFVIIGIASCSSLRHYKAVNKDVVTGEINNEQKLMLAKTCSTAFPIIIKEGTASFDTIYTNDDSASNGCAAIIDSLIKLKQKTIHINSADTLYYENNYVSQEMFDSIKNSLLSKYQPKSKTVYIKVVDTIENDDKISALTLDNQAVTDKLTAFENSKKSSWQTFKWFCSTIGWWWWLIIGLLLGSSILLKLLKYAK